MRQWILLTVMILLIWGCGKNNSIKQIDNKQDQFRIITYNQKLGGLFTCRDTVERVNIDNDTSWAFYYKSAKNKYDFNIYVNKNEPSNGFVKYYNDSLGHYYNFIESKLFEVNNNSYQVLKLSYSDAPIDGEHDIYFNKDFGLLCIQSRAWNNWTEYKCLNDSVNQIVTCLQIQIYKDFMFYWDLESGNIGNYKRKK